MPDRAIASGAMAENVKLFLSCVSDEFWAERKALRHELTGLTVDVAVQEDFVSLGVDTLAKLDAYIRQCDVVVHLAGDKAGATPAPESAEGLLIREPEVAARLVKHGLVREALANLTYTQWEAWLAVFYGKPLLIARSAPAAQSAPAPAQAAHLRLLQQMDRYPEITFATRDQFVKDVFKSLFAILGGRTRRARRVASRRSRDA